MKVSREKLQAIVDRVCGEFVTDEDLVKVVELVNRCQDDIPATWPSRNPSKPRRKKDGDDSTE